jgi:hypothetical protein
MVYPKNQKVACSTAGGSKGAIDPKTLHKYLWPMIRAISNLEVHVVSNFCLLFNYLSLLLQLTPLMLTWFYSRIGLRTTSSSTAFWMWMRRILRGLIPTKIGILTSSSVMRWLFRSWEAIFSWERWAFVSSSLWWFGCRMIWIRLTTNPEPIVGLSFLVIYT